MFRHGIYKNTYQQIPPHLLKIECDELLKNNKIYGCCTPFYFCKNKIINESTINICDYILIAFIGNVLLKYIDLVNST